MTVLNICKCCKRGAKFSTRQPFFFWRLDYMLGIFQDQVRGKSQTKSSPVSHTNQYILLQQEFIFTGCNKCGNAV